MKLPFLSRSPETKGSLPCLVLREQVTSLSGSPANAHLKSDVCLLRVQPSDCKQLALPICQPLYGRPLWPLPSQSFCYKFNLCEPLLKWVITQIFKYCSHSCLSRMDPGDDYPFVLYGRKKSRDKLVYVTVRTVFILVELNIKLVFLWLSDDLQVLLSKKIDHWAHRLLTAIAETMWYSQG